MKNIFLIIIIVLLLLNLWYMYSCSKNYEKFESSITPEQLNVLTKLSPHLIAIKTLADLSSSLMNGSLTIPGGLNIQGPLTVNNTVTVNGDTTLKKILRVEGATDLKNNVLVRGATNLNTLTVDGNATLNKTVTVNDDTLTQSVLVRGALTVKGDTNLNSKVIIGIPKPLPVGTTPPVANNILTVNGDTLLKEILRVEGATDLKKTLVVRSFTSLEDTVEAPKSIRTPKILISNDIVKDLVIKSYEKGIIFGFINEIGYIRLIFKDGQTIGIAGQNKWLTNGNYGQQGIVKLPDDNKDLKNVY